MTPETPEIHCVCCQQPLEAKYQPPLRQGNKGYFHVTCVNDACPMFGYTLTDLSYPPMDLAPYLKSGQERLAAQRKEQV